MIKESIPHSNHITKTETKTCNEILQKDPNLKTKTVKLEKYL